MEVGDKYVVHDTLYCKKVPDNSGKLWMGSSSCRKHLYGIEGVNAQSGMMSRFARHSRAGHYKIAISERADRMADKLEYSRSKGLLVILEAWWGRDRIEGCSSCPASYSHDFRVCGKYAKQGKTQEPDPSLSTHISTT